MNENNGTSGLWAGLVAAQRAGRTVAKDGKNAHHGYKYATSEDVIEEARGALSAGELALFAEASSLREIIPASGEGSAYEPPLYVVDSVYVLAHASGGTHRITSSTFVMPEKGRPFDKALAAARTYDLAYTLRSLLLLPRGEADHPDQRDDRAWSPAKTVSAKSAIMAAAGRLATPPARDVLAEARQVEPVRATAKTDQPREEFRGRVDAAYAAYAALAASDAASTTAKADQPRIAGEDFRVRVEVARSRLAELIRGDQEEMDGARARASAKLGRATLGNAADWLANADVMIAAAVADAAGVVA